MARLGGGTGRYSEASSNNQITCDKCGEGFEREGIFRGGEIAHCDGLSWAFGSRMRDEKHHCVRKHPRCWACGADLGCSRCSGILSQLLCANANMHGKLSAVWATREALLEHGILRGQTIDDYPAEWREAYRRTADAAVAGMNNIDALLKRVIH